MLKKALLGSLSTDRCQDLEQTTTAHSRGPMGSEDQHFHGESVGHTVAG
jgi:hypothetical protein